MLVTSNDIHREFVFTSRQFLNQLRELAVTQLVRVVPCLDETFDDTVGKSAGLHAFAIRMYMEGGATTCMDNGIASQKKTSLEATPSDPIEALSFYSGYRFFSY